jgi:hypothetical protein
MKLFEHFARKNAKTKPSKTKGPHFGRAMRFEKSEEDLWRDKIKRYNDHTEGSQIDIKKGPRPGVGEYNLLERWKGKKVENKLI